MESGKTMKYDLGELILHPGNLTKWYQEQEEPDEPREDKRQKMRHPGNSVPRMGRIHGGLGKALQEIYALS